MKISTTTWILLCAVVAALLSLFGGDGYKQLSNVKRSLDLQRVKNVELRTKVEGLKEDVYGLKRDPRMLEKAARNELAVAAEDEVIVIFKER